MLARLSQYGAISAKVHAIWGNRLTREDFSLLFDMKTVGEAAAFLKNHPNWAAGLGGIDPAAVHRSELENALRAHVLAQYLNLFHYVSRQDAPLMRYPVLRTEMEQIMAFQRLASAGQSEKYTLSLPPYFERHSRIQYQALSRAETYDDMLDAVRQTGFYKALYQLRREDGAFPPFVFVERAMYSYYFRAVFELIDKRTSGDTRKILRDDVGLQVDMMNASSALRVLSFFPHLRGDVLSYQLTVTYNLSSSFLRRLCVSANMDEAMALMRSSSYGAYFSKHSFDSFGDYFLEMAYENARKSLSGIPSVHTPMAYVSLRETELQNLISAIECVRYNVPADRAWSYIVGMRA